jgi:hypothetical protein
MKLDPSLGFLLKFVPYLTANLDGIVFINRETKNMNTVVIVVSLIILLLVGAIATYKGFDLRRGSTWLYVGISFLCSLVLGFNLSGHLVESLKVAGMLAFLTLLTGMVMRRHKQKYEGMARSLILEYGKEDDPSLFAKLVRKLLGRYK